MNGTGFALVLGVTALVFYMAAVLALMLVFNWSVPPAFGLDPISYADATKLSLLPVAVTLPAAIAGAAAQMLMRDD